MNDEATVYGMKCHICLFISTNITIFYVKPKACPICGSKLFSIWNAYGVIVLEC